MQNLEERIQEPLVIEQMSEKTEMPETELVVGKIYTLREYSRLKGKFITSIVRLLRAEFSWIHFEILDGERPSEYDCYPSKDMEYFSGITYFRYHARRIF